MPSSARAQHVKTWRSLQKAHSSLVGDLDESLRGHGLTVNEFDVLVNLSPTQARRHLDLTSRVLLTRTALTRMIDRLIDRGLLERTSHPTDRHGVLVRLTPAGRDLRRAAVRSSGRALKTRLGGLTGAQLSELARLTALIAGARDTDPLTDTMTDTAADDVSSTDPGADTDIDAGIDTGIDADTDAGTDAVRI